MGRCHVVRRLLVGVIFFTLSAGCAPGASSTRTPAPATSAAAITYGPVAVIEGTADCSFVESTSTTDPSGVQHARASVTCVATFNDPRASGTYSGTWNADIWGVPPSNMALVQWEDARITNAGGSWEGRQTGVYSTTRGDAIAGWFIGKGGYAGLTLFELTTGSGPWTIEGQIFPGKPPTP